MLMRTCWLAYNYSNKGKIYPRNVYNQIKEICIRKFKSKSLLVLDPSENTSNSNNHEISGSKI